MNTPRRAPWSDRRRMFNHDWLKNRYLLSLNSWLRVLSGSIEDPEFEKVFMSDVLPQWELHRGEARELIETFVIEMSPRTLFDTKPLARCDRKTKLWLSEVVHSLWSERVSLRLLVKTAQEALLLVDAAYARVASYSNTAMSGAPVARFGRAYGDFTCFRDSCQALGEAFSKFPGIIVTI